MPDKTSSLVTHTDNSIIISAAELKAFREWQQLQSSQSNVYKQSSPTILQPLYQKTVPIDPLLLQATDIGKCSELDKALISPSRKLTAIQIGPTRGSNMIHEDGQPVRSTESTSYQPKKKSKSADKSNSTLRKDKQTKTQLTEFIASSFDDDTSDALSSSSDDDEIKDDEQDDPQSEEPIWKILGFPTYKKPFIKQYTKLRADICNIIESKPARWICDTPFSECTGRGKRQAIIMKVQNYLSQTGRENMSVRVSTRLISSLCNNRRRNLARPRLDHLKENNIKPKVGRPIKNGKYAKLPLSSSSEVLSKASSDSVSIQKFDSHKKSSTHKQMHTIQEVAKLKTTLQEGKSLSQAVKNNSIVSSAMLPIFDSSTSMNVTKSEIIPATATIESLGQRYETVDKEQLSMPVMNNSMKQLSALTKPEAMPLLPYSNYLDISSSIKTVSIRGTEMEMTINHEDGLKNIIDRLKCDDAFWYKAKGKGPSFIVDNSETFERFFKTSGDLEIWPHTEHEFESPAPDEGQSISRSIQNSTISGQIISTKFEKPTVFPIHETSSIAMITDQNALHLSESELSNYDTLKHTLESKTKQNKTDSEILKLETLLNTGTNQSIRSGSQRVLRSRKPITRPQADIEKENRQKVKETRSKTKATTRVIKKKIMMKKNRKPAIDTDKVA
ncbi:hypothetical protein EDC01DRAFT_630633 [Geopyxis carbonaria]|nr:hypothetical protein EDC01DRAFT_630633 [Geopyxis carbonaria]